MTPKKIILSFFLLAIVIMAGLFLWSHFHHAPAASRMPVFSEQNTQKNMDIPVNSNANILPSAKTTSGFTPPLSHAAERVTKKPFGKFITPQDSPVQPERFRGYHTGADFEIFPAELNAVVPVQAICDGKLLLKESATGYGGVAVESCLLNGAPITVVYGHLKLASISAKAGDKLSAGDALGILGADKSVETDGERKHLHLGIHSGAKANILGYVQSKAALSDWIDPCLYVCGK